MTVLKHKFQLGRAVNDMDSFVNKKSSSLKEYSYIGSVIIAMFLVFIFAFMFLKFPQETGNGIKSGLSLCFSSVIPSLFPFMIISSFFSESSLCSIFASAFKRATRLIFDLPGICTSVILFSMFGGFPVGASMTGSLFEKKLISNSQAQRLLMFCVCPGPAFVISAVGVSMLGSKKGGIIIYVSLVISALLTGFISRFLVEEDKNEELFLNTPVKKGSYSQALVNSVSKSIGSIIHICGWIALFSALISLNDVLIRNNNIKEMLTCILEVTNGCKASAGKIPLSFIAGIIGWGGICTHFQIMPDVIKIKMKLWLFALFRFINAVISTVVCRLLVLAFPTEINVMNQSGARFAFSQNSSYAVSVCLLMMSVLLLLGNGFVMKYKNQNEGGT